MNWTLEDDVATFGHATHYILDGHEAKPASFKEWMAWAMEGAKHGEFDTRKRVAETTLPDGRWVSTVFLGINHQFWPEGPPLIFESMLFASKDNLNEEDCERYSTWEEAKAGHVAMVARHSPATNLPASTYANEQTDA